MKKRAIITTVAVLAVAGSLFITPVQTFAVNAMGVFRVADRNVINISMDDMTGMAQNLQTLMAAQQQNGDGQTDGRTNEQALSQAKQDPAELLTQYSTPLNSAADFAAFPFKLPAYFQGQMPELTEIDPPAQTVTVNTAKMNKTLAALQSPVMLPDSLNGRKATVTPSPMVMAKYDGAICFAAQKPSFDLPGNLESTVTQIITTLPLLPDDLRSQLGDISLFDRTIYLPNVEGVTKTADLGGNTGYIYAVNDLAALGDSLLSSLQSGQSGQDQSAGESLTQALQKYAGCEAILWVNNNTLYGVAGKYTDDQLAAIARTMQ